MELALIPFAETVNAVASSAAEWMQPYPGKVYVSCLAEALAKQPATRGVSLDRVKEMLVLANSRGLVHLSRCDMPQCFDRAKVDASEIRHCNATFHFVRV